MAGPYATDADLTALLPSVFTHDVASFTAQLQLASDDVLEAIKTEWWPQAAAARLGVLRESVDYDPLFPTFDETKLNTAKLKNLTCYLALSRYIFPLLANDSDVDGDEFTRKMERYTAFYEGEWGRVKLMPLYDWNGDAQFSDIERRLTPHRTLSRA